MRRLTRQRSHLMPSISYIMHTFTVKLSSLPCAQSSSLLEWALSRYLLHWYTLSLPSALRNPSNMGSAQSVLRRKKKTRASTPTLSVEPTPRHNSSSPYSVLQKISNLGSAQSVLERENETSPRTPILPVELFVLIEEFLLGDDCFGTAAQLNLTCRTVHQVS